VAREAGDEGGASRGVTEKKRIEDSVYSERTCPKKENPLLLRREIEPGEEGEGRDG